MTTTITANDTITVNVNGNQLRNTLASFKTLSSVGNIGLAFNQNELIISDIYGDAIIATAMPIENAGISGTVLISKDRLKGIANNDTVKFTYTMEKNTIDCFNERLFIVNDEFLGPILEQNFSESVYLDNSFIKSLYDCLKFSINDYEDVFAIKIEAKDGISNISSMTAHNAAIFKNDKIISHDTVLFSRNFILTANKIFSKDSNVYFSESENYYKMDDNFVSIFILKKQLRCFDLDMLLMKNNVAGITLQANLLREAVKTVTSIFNKKDTNTITFDLRHDNVIISTSNNDLAKRIVVPAHVEGFIENGSERVNRINLEGIQCLEMLKHYGKEDTITLNFTGQYSVCKISASYYGSPTFFTSPVKRNDICDVKRIAEAVLDQSIKCDDKKFKNAIDNIAETHSYQSCARMLKKEYGYIIEDIKIEYLLRQYFGEDGYLDDMPERTVSAFEETIADCPYLSINKQGLKEALTTVNKLRSKYTQLIVKHNHVIIRAYSKNKEFSYADIAIDAYNSGISGVFYINDDNFQRLLKYNEDNFRVTLYYKEDKLVTEQVLLFTDNIEPIHDYLVSENGLPIDKNEFIGVLKDCFRTLLRDAPDTYINCIHIRPNINGGTIFTAMDGHSLQTIKSTIKLGDHTFLLPYAGAKTIVNIFEKSKKQLFVCPGEKHIKVQCGNISIVVGKSNETYPDTSVFLARKAKAQAVSYLQCDDMLNAFRELEPIVKNNNADGRVKNYHVKIDDGTFTVYAKSEHAERDVTFSAKTYGKIKSEDGYDYNNIFMATDRYLHLLPSFAGKRIQLHFCGQTSQTFITSSEDETRQLIVMPVKGIESVPNFIDRIANTVTDYGNFTSEYLRAETKRDNIIKLFHILNSSCNALEFIRKLFKNITISPLFISEHMEEICAYFAENADHVSMLFACNQTYGTSLDVPALPYGDSFYAEADTDTATGQAEHTEQSGEAESLPVAGIAAATDMPIIETPVDRNFPEIEIEQEPVIEDRDYKNTIYNICTGSGYNNVRYFFSVVHTCGKYSVSVLKRYFVDKKPTAETTVFPVENKEQALMLARSEAIEHGYDITTENISQQERYTRYTYDDITSRVIEYLEKGIIPWKKPWTVNHVNMISGKAYSGINSFILNMTDYKSPYWLSWKQITKLGGRVKKNAKGGRYQRGMPIIFFCRFDKEKERKDGTGTYNIVVKPSIVYNIEQCEGITAPEQKTDTRSAEPIDVAENIVLSMPNKPIIENGFPGASYTLATDEVHMPLRERFHSSAGYYETLFHELGHSTRHQSRLARKDSRGEVKGHCFGTPDYSQEELVAEMCSAFLCGQCGIERETLENNAAYIQSWLKVFRNDKRFLVDAAGQAQKAANYILGRIARAETSTNAETGTDIDIEADTQAETEHENLS
jgi:antirestriction protein ArdC